MQLTSTVLTLALLASVMYYKMTSALESIQLQSTDTSTVGQKLEDSLKGETADLIVFFNGITHNGNRNVSLVPLLMQCIRHCIVLLSRE